MKAVSLIAFFLCMATTINAQYKNNVFVDADLDGSIGASATYNYRATKHLGIGAGAQILTPGNNTKTAVFADMRKYWIKNKGAWLLFVDLGFDLFKDKGLLNYQKSDNAFYTGLGFGYCYVINQQGWGPYATLRFAADNRILNSTVQSGHETTVYDLDGSPVVSIGFKF